jgi:hypothetical protein
LFRWFVGLPIDAEVWHATVFTHNRDWLLESREFLAALLRLPPELSTARLASPREGKDHVRTTAWLLPLYELVKAHVFRRRADPWR